jgi:hypothetical protein
MWSESFATRAYTGDPQREQKHPPPESFGVLKRPRVGANADPRIFHFLTRCPEDQSRVETRTNDYFESRRLEPRLRFL